MTLVLIVVLSIAWILPGATAPPWKGRLNQSPEYPRQLLAMGDLHNIPSLGHDTGFVFDRIALVEHSGSKVLLKDPFSDTVVREANAEEIELIGNHPYVIDTYGQPADRQLMLTFDDGPDARFTPELLDLLSKEGVPATFFAVGSNIVKNPEVFKRTIREGHMMANHSMFHSDFWAHDDAYNREEIIGTDRVMRGTDNYATRLFRIPTGDPENNSLALLQAQQLGFLHINMDLDTLDWDVAPGETLEVPELDGKGHIVLVHDGGGDRTATINMLKTLIPQAKAQGYTFTTLQPLLPPEYVPQRITPDIGDHVTVVTYTGALVAPDVVITWLFWFGVGSLTVLTFLYVVLALISNSRQKRRRWNAIPEESWPFVSVVLPVYNEEPVVTRTLAALQASDYPRFEVVAVNDGSTDGTLAVLTEYARKWPQMRVLDQPNGGKSEASNNGILHSRGEVVVTLDGDTLFEPQTIRMLARHFCQNGHAGKKLGAVAGHVKVGNRRNLLTAWQSLEYLSGICVTRMAEGLIGAISIVPGACAAWRREALLQAGGYSTDTLAEDADLTLSLQSLGYSIAQENEAIAWTEAPMTITGLAKQRLRWTYGNIQTIYKHRAMILNPHYGALGLLSLPYALLSVLVPLVFMPMTLVVAAANLAAGEWQAIAIFAVFVAATHLIISTVAIIMVREDPRHMLMVPIYRLIYEPLRAYVIFGATFQALRGHVVGWYKPERTNSVLLPLPAEPAT